MKSSKRAEKVFFHFVFISFFLEAEQQEQKILFAGRVGVCRYACECVCVECECVRVFDCFQQPLHAPALLLLLLPLLLLLMLRCIRADVRRARCPTGD